MLLLCQTDAFRERKISKLSEHFWIICYWRVYWAISNDVTLNCWLWSVKFMLWIHNLAAAIFQLSSHQNTHLYLTYKIHFHLLFLPDQISVVLKLFNPATWLHEQTLELCDTDCATKQVCLFLTPSPFKTVSCVPTWSKSSRTVLFRNTVNSK